MAAERPNPVIALLAEIALDVVRRRRETATRRAKLAIVKPAKDGGQAA